MNAEGRTYKVKLLETRSVAFHAAASAGQYVTEACAPMTVQPPQHGGATLSTLHWNTLKLPSFTMLAYSAILDEEQKALRLSG